MMRDPGTMSRQRMAAGMRAAGGTATTITRVAEPYSAIPYRAGEHP